ncbi:MAG: hypothetical protein ACRDQ7_15720 [Haloechinothrix sp.]
MTTTMCRTEAQLLHALADQWRTYRYRSMHDALHAVMHGESTERWTNLVAAIGMDLHIEPINAYDRDELHVADGQRDHPAAYATRLDIWAARIGDPAVIAATLDQLADVEERELTAGGGQP